MLTLNVGLFRDHAFYSKPPQWRSLIKYMWDVYGNRPDFLD